MPFRAFISLDIGGLASLAQVIGELDSTGAQIKTVDPSLVHITLKFLGDVDEAKVPGIVDSMKEAARGVPPFEVRLKRVGAFPSASRARVVWVGMEGAAPIVGMAARLDDALSSLGFEREQRSFSPHVTIGRMKGSRGAEDVRRVIQQNQDKDFGEYGFSALRLKKSVLGPKGPTYSTVEEVGLEG